MEFHKENHNIVRLHRFRNMMWEEKYLVKSLNWRWYSCMIHFYSRVVLSIPFVFLLQSQTTITFWLYFSIVMCGAMFLLLGHFSFSCRHRIVELHFVFSVVMLGIDTYMIPQQSTSFAQFTYKMWIPNPMYHLILVSPNGQETVDAKFFSFLQESSAIPISSEIFSTSVPVLVFTALAGLTPYTIPAQVLIMLGMALSAGLTPNITTFSLAWHIVMSLLCCIFSFIFAVVSERSSRSQFLTETLLARELHASQTADSILNHTLKNILSDAAATLELYLAGQGERDTLESAIGGLRRGMRACKNRQVYLKLVGGEYAPHQHTVDLQEFVKELVAGRDVQSNASKMIVHTDAVLLNLVLENAISNAFQHGHPSDPQVQLNVDTSPLSNDPFSLHRSSLHFTVSNLANPRCQELTPERVDCLLMGNAEVPPNAVVPALSDCIGIAHCVLAAKAGHIALHMAQEGNVVTFRASVEVDVLPEEPLAPTASNGPAAAQFPHGLCFAILDDSLAARRLLQFHITTWCSPGTVRCFGEREEDIDAFCITAAAEADIVILDQNLAYSQLHLGSDIARKLVQSGFAGFICLRSANDSTEDQALYLRSGAHCCFGKDLLGRQLMTELMQHYCRFREGAAVRRPAGAPPPCTMAELPGSQQTSFSSFPCAVSSGCVQIDAESPNVPCGMHAWVPL